MRTNQRIIPENAKSEKLGDVNLENRICTTSYFIIAECGTGRNIEKRSRSSRGLLRFFTSLISIGVLFMWFGSSFKFESEMAVVVTLHMNFGAFYRYFFFASCNL